MSPLEQAAAVTSCDAEELHVRDRNPSRPFVEHRTQCRDSLQGVCDSV